MDFAGPIRLLSNTRAMALVTGLALAGCSLILETRPFVDAGRDSTVIRDAQALDAADTAVGSDVRVDAVHDANMFDASDAQGDHDVRDSIDVPTDRGILLDTADVPMDRGTALDTVDVPVDRGTPLDTVDVPVDHGTPLDVTDVRIDRPAAIDATSTDGCVGGPPCGFTCATPYDAVTNGSYAINPCGTAPIATLVCAGVSHTAVTTYWAFDVPAGGCHVTWPVGYIVLEQAARCATSGVCCTDATCPGSQALVEGQYLFAIQRADATCEVNLVEIFCP